MNPASPVAAPVVSAGPVVKGDVHADVVVLVKKHGAKFAGEGQSLTPQEPLDPRELEAAIAPYFAVAARSGVRVFHDYMPQDFQQRAALEDLVAMELAHRRHPAFAGLGRYLHWICQPV